ncbi:hypothetical protein DERP_012605 [Dermatophagoides pteronyssinus]|uniref:Secreted protein n=1 Tax=Dermatophagoides pteronyssinus TaxID=6956 RepID=A0ABQ8IUY2_DERPT|nr:hypothetical protein DERP_012605 [Dermatophagoides pteronyssinus]
MSTKIILMMIMIMMMMGLLDTKIKFESVRLATILKSTTSPIDKYDSYANYNNNDDIHNL